MLVKAVLQKEKWQHQVNRRSPVLSLGLKNPASWSNTIAFAVVENTTAFFMVSRYRGTVNFYYCLEASTKTSLIREVGDFDGFDSVSVVFNGLRFHWNRESEKIVITDAVARQRDFDTLTIE